MGKLIYSMNVSLDGYVEAPDHALDWANVDEELHTWFNDRAREADAFLYGRRLYEVMAASWPTAESAPSATDAMLDFARIWNDHPRSRHALLPEARDPDPPAADGGPDVRLRSGVSGLRRGIASAAARRATRSRATISLSRESRFWPGARPGSPSLRIVPHALDP